MQHRRNISSSDSEANASELLKDIEEIENCSTGNHRSRNR